MSAKTPIVLFGAAGGLGRRVLALLPDDHDVIPVDRALDPPYDLADPIDLCKLAERLPPRVIGINVTGTVSTAVDADTVAASVRNNIQSPGVIVSGLGDRLEHLVHLSSISVYGSQGANPISEVQALRPESVYGISKSAGELLVRALCSSSGCPLTVIRATQLFALASADDALPHLLVRGLGAGETPQLTADPGTRRDYLHVDDAAQLIVRAALAGRAGTFNAGSGGGDVTLVFIKPPANLDITSDGGDITVLLPHGSTAYRVSSSADGGDDSVSVPTSALSHNTISVDSGGGDITIAEAS